MFFCKQCWRSCVIFIFPSSISKCFFCHCAPLASGFAEGAARRVELDLTQYIEVGCDAKVVVKELFRMLYCDELDVDTLVADFSRVESLFRVTQFLQLRPDIFASYMDAFWKRGRDKLRVARFAVATNCADCLRALQTPFSTCPPGGFQKLVELWAVLWGAEQSACADCRDAACQVNLKSKACHVTCVICVLICLIMSGFVEQLRKVCREVQRGCEHDAATFKESDGTRIDCFDVYFEEEMRRAMFPAESVTHLVAQLEVMLVADKKLANRYMEPKLRELMKFSADTAAELRAKTTQLNLAELIKNSPELGTRN